MTGLWPAAALLVIIGPDPAWAGPPRHAIPAAKDALWVFTIERVALRVSVPGDERAEAEARAVSGHARQVWVSELADRGVYVQTRGYNLGAEFHADFAPALDAERCAEGWCDGPGTRFNFGWNDNPSWSGVVVVSPTRWLAYIRATVELPGCVGESSAPGTIRVSSLGNGEEPTMGTMRMAPPSATLRVVLCSSLPARAKGRALGAELAELSVGSGLVGWKSP